MTEPQSASNLFSSHGMRHASNPDRISAYNTRLTNLLEHQTAQRRAALERRIQNIKQGKEYPRSYMTHNISDEDALKLYYDLTIANKPLVKARKPRGDRPPYSWAERQQQKAARKAAQKAGFDAYFTGKPEYSGWDARDKELAYARGRKIAHQLVSLPRKKMTEQEAADAKLRRQYRQLYPNAVLKPEAEAILKDKAFDGEDYTNPLHQDWVGQYPQRMDPKKREEAARTFAEMTGMLGWMPTYDARLTTVESAKQLYNPEDYDIQIYDMDMNDYTPGNVIIKKKFDVDRDGNRVELPKSDWKIVAANGYRLPDPSATQQYGRLKTMGYYSKHPSTRSRKAEPFSLYVRNTPAFAPKSKGALAPVKNLVRKMINNKWNPIAVQNSDVHLPYLFTLSYNGDRTNLIMSMSPIAFNSYVSNIARIWSAIRIYPNALKSLRTAASGGQRRTSYLHGIFEAYVESLGKAPALINPEIYHWWENAKLLDPRIETVLHRDAYIHQAVERVCDGISAKLSLPDEGAKYYLEVSFIGDIVIKLFMNFYKDSIDKILQQGGLGEYSDATVRFTLFDGKGHDDARSLQMIKSGAFTPLPITPKKNDEIAAMYHVIYWGNEYIEGAAAAAAQAGLTTTTSSSSSSSSSSMYDTPPEEKSDSEPDTDDVLDAIKGDTEEVKDE